MKKYLSRLRWISPGVKMHPMMYPMFFYTILFGVAFIFFGDTTTVQASILFQLTQVHLATFATSIWGAVCLFATMLALANIVFRKKALGLTGGWIGLLVWLFAFILCLINGYVFQALAFTPQLAFWKWHQQRVRQYYQDEDLLASIRGGTIDK